MGIIENIIDIIFDSYDDLSSSTLYDGRFMG